MDTALQRQGSLGLVGLRDGRSERVPGPAPREAEGEEGEVPEGEEGSEAEGEEGGEESEESKE